MSDTEFSPWKARFDSVVARLKQGGEWEIGQVMARVMPPDTKSFLDEFFRRASEGEIDAFYRVPSSDPASPPRDIPYDDILPDDAITRSETRMLLRAAI